MGILLTGKPPVAACPASKATTVMVVDADPLTRWSLSHYLGRWVEVRTAASLSEARALLGQLRPAVLIVGDEFPDGAGEELMCEVRRGCRGARLIRISVETQAARGGKDPRQGEVTIEKPFALARIAALIGIDPR